MTRRRPRPDYHREPMRHHAVVGETWVVHQGRTVCGRPSRKVLTMPVLTIEGADEFMRGRRPGRSLHFPCLRCKALVVAAVERLHRSE